MTRINLIPVKELTDQHLLAEHRELKRIPSMIQKGRVNFENIPHSFVLGTGHVKFFYNKLSFLKKRYIELYQECIERGFQVQNYLSSFENIDIDLFQDFTPTLSDLTLSRERIEEKLYERPDFYRYYGKHIA